ncbi:hypothetical protein RRF57_012082 [Xylaria bambusicola]|uniref:CFEM domain-containing protein n=1 Tax=Xylaria bambusicola TaxID=326684 RepID=A0AAN7UNZ0_9PEZI
MKTSVVFAAISAGGVVAVLPPPENFPACGTTCFGNMLNQASQLGCGDSGSTEDAVDGACLCKNPDFSYGIIDCANAACPQGVAPTVIQYGVDWCADRGVVIGGLSATPSSEFISSATATISAAATASSDSSTSLGSETVIVATTTNSDVSPPRRSWSLYPRRMWNQLQPTVDGSAVTTTVASTVFSTSTAAATGSDSATESSSAPESTFVTETTATISVTSTTDTSTDTGAATSTDSDGGSRPTAIPVGLAAAAGLAALML